MARKTSNFNNSADLRAQIIKNLVGLMDENPPLGESQPALLKTLILKAYQETGASDDLIITYGIISSING